MKRYKKLAYWLYVGILLACLAGSIYLHYELSKQYLYYQPYVKEQELYAALGWSYLAVCLIATLVYLEYVIYIINQRHYL